MKVTERELAVTLRRQGMSYREILHKVPVAKSTLSTWLRSVELAKKQYQRLTRKKKEAALKGAALKRLKKENLIKEIKASARLEIGRLTFREQWLIGTALYWAEGSKEKIYKPGLGLVFNNSDPAMVRFYVQWLERVCKIPREKIHLSLYIHETKVKEISAVSKFWTNLIMFPSDSIRAVYLKRNKVATNRRNTGVLYYGTLRVKVSMSSGLNRKVSGWIEGIIAAE